MTRDATNKCKQSPFEPPTPIINYQSQHGIQVLQHLTKVLQHWFLLEPQTQHSSTFFIITQHNSQKYYFLSNTHQQHQNCIEIMFPANHTSDSNIYLKYQKESESSKWICYGKLRFFFKNLIFILGFNTLIGSV